MDIVPYSATLRDGIDRLNARLAAAGSEWSFPPRERPRDADRLPVWEESFIVVDGQDVYGGYVLKHQKFFLGGEPIDVGNLQMPLSLGEVDSAFSHISVALLFDVLRRAPRVYSVGLGSEETRFAKLLTAAEWQHKTIPFYFSVKSPNRFARNIRLPAGRARLQSVLRLLGQLRLAGVAMRAQRILARRSTRPPRAPAYDQVREVPRFDRSADDLFEATAGAYSLVGDRRAHALNCLYPPGDSRYIRLLVSKNGQAVGWALVLDTAMREDKYFGDLRVGSLADCFGAPEAARAVVAAADDYLARRGVDIVVSNQVHPSWCDALEAAGYQQGPSNFFFYYSSELAERLEAVSAWERAVHVNRGDGEGPTGLTQ